jgi:uncharacterized cupin superfamily protein
MSGFVRFNVASPGAGREGNFAAERILEGEPSYKVWEKDNCGDGRIRSGIWEATPGAFRVVKGENWEYCTILSGVVELIEDGGETHRLAAGDTFVMRPGFVANWKTIETVRKLWVVVS